MATGLCEGGTARNEGLLEAGREGTPMVPYRAVLLLRQPVEVVQSILHMGMNLDPDERNTNLEHVTSYYVARLERLTDLARKLGRRAAFIERWRAAKH